MLDNLLYMCVHLVCLDAILANIYSRILFPSHLSPPLVKLYNLGSTAFQTNRLTYIGLVGCGAHTMQPVSQFKVSTVYPQIVQTIPGDNLYWGKTSYAGIKYPSCGRSLGCLSTMVVWFIYRLDNDRALTSAKSGTTN